MIKYTKLHSLNEAQSNAVAASFQQYLSIIQGPPGTGKTKVAVSILMANHEVHEHVQVCAQTNLAVDEVLFRLSNNNVKLYRYGIGDRFPRFMPLHCVQFLWRK